MIISPIAVPTKSFNSELTKAKYNVQALGYSYSITSFASIFDYCYGWYNENTEIFYPIGTKYYVIIKSSLIQKVNNMEVYLYF